MKPETAQQSCIENKNLEHERYFITIQLVLALKHFFNNNHPKWDVAAVELTMKSNQNNTIKKVTPDVIFQTKDGKEGIICEIKTSLSEDDEYLFEKISNITKYDPPLIGWKTPSGELENNHSILLIDHVKDFPRVTKKIEQWIKEDRISFNNSFCIANWNKTTALRLENKEIYIFRYEYGDLSSKDFLILLKDTIQVSDADISRLYEKNKFTRIKPPDSYLMDILWFQILNLYFIPESDSITVKIETLYEDLQPYYPSWTGLEGEPGQIRISWIKEAMEQFCQINLAERNESENSYKIYFKKRIPKNFKKYIIERLCKKIKYKDPNQHNLDTFS